MRRIPTIVIAAVLLAGCFEMRGDVRVEKDGSGQVVFMLGVRESAADMLPAQKRAQLCDVPELEKTLGRPQQVRADGYVWCRFARDFPHLSYLKTEILTARDEGGGYWSMRVDLARLLASRGKGRPGESEMALIRPMLIGQYATFRILAPKMVETNGQLRDDGKTAVYRLPLIDALDAPAEGKPLTFTARFTCREGWLWGWKC